MSPDPERRGVDAPDGRGRSGLDRVGRDLDRNPNVVIRDVEVTSDGWHVLRRTTYDYRRADGSWEAPQRETNDRGVRRVHEPGSVTERLHFFSAPYTPADRTGGGGGLQSDGEDIEIVELRFADAMAMVADGRIADGKTIMLLYWAALYGPFAGVTAR